LLLDARGSLWARYFCDRWDGSQCGTIGFENWYAFAPGREPTPGGLLWLGTPGVGKPFYYLPALEGERVRVNAVDRARDARRALEECLHAVCAEKRRALDKAMALFQDFKSEGTARDKADAQEALAHCYQAAGGHLESPTR
jgi:hypothetical protein